MSSTNRSLAERQWGDGGTLFHKKFYRVCLERPTMIRSRLAAITGLHSPSILHLDAAIRSQHSLMHCRTPARTLVCLTVRSQMPHLGLRQRGSRVARGLKACWYGCLRIVGSHYQADFCQAENARRSHQQCSVECIALCCHDRSERCEE